ncbi:MAG TPA: DNA polymerase domain-containing protein, partial [Candidatus Nitrosocosmicus sp.]
KHNITNEEESKTNMYEIAKYCAIDAKRCYELLEKMHVIDTYIEVSGISYMTIHDAYCYASGSKVCNLLGRYAYDMNIMITMNRNETCEESGKYPGAYVFPPIKRLEKKRPVTGLDFGSLYPSLMMTYNLSPEMIVLDPEKLDPNIDYHEIKFMYNDREIRAWCVRHGNDDKKKGLYPVVLEMLKEKRIELKKKLKQLNEQIKNGIFDIYTIYERDLIDIKQIALKVYMNSFYGETGNPLSPFFQLIIAGAVTSSGQYNIKLAADYVTSLGFTIKYGDTDSLYITCPDNVYYDIDKAYENEEINREEYYSEMVRITIRTICELRDKVNEYLENDNGTKYLRMEYEEVLFPVMFTGKKKYFGIAHEDKPNFEPEELFVRGMDVVRREKSGFSKDICNEMMWIMMDIHNDSSPMNIIENVIKKRMLKRYDDIEEFIQSATYRPDKKNLYINDFVKRMKRMGAIINPNDTFEYVVIKHLDKNINKSKKMILKSLFDPKNHKLDMKYYLKEIISPCARFVNGEFDGDDETAQKKAETYIRNMITRIDDSINNESIKKYFKRIHEDDNDDKSSKKRKLEFKKVKDPISNSIEKYFKRKYDIDDNQSESNKKRNL